VKKSPTFPTNVNGTFPRTFHQYPLPEHTTKETPIVDIIYNSAIHSSLPALSRVPDEATPEVSGAV
jgi:hypothetical protein